MTSSTGCSGLMRSGSPPRSTIASRIAARSTTQGTPVKSCSSTRDGMKEISFSTFAVAFHSATARISLAFTNAPSSRRSRFSRRIFIEYGRRATPVKPDFSSKGRLQISTVCPPARISVRVLNVSRVVIPILNDTSLKRCQPSGTWFATACVGGVLMDQNKNPQAQPTQGHQGQQRTDRDQNKSGRAPDNHRDQAEGEREQTRGGSSNMGSQERGTGSKGERNSSMSESRSSSGISNRGMSSRDEQSDLPSRGSSSDSNDQSER